MNPKQVFKIEAKIFAAGNDLSHPAAVAAFHRWIQNQAVPNHMLIDVADYAHVVAGPGTVLVSAEANFYLDRGDNRLGLLYSRKLPLPGAFRDRLRYVLLEALKAAARLEQEKDLGLSFRTDEIAVRLNDRLLAPPTPETFAAIEPDLLAVAAEIFGDNSIRVEPRLAPLTLAEARIRAAKNQPVSALLDRLALSASA